MYCPKCGDVQILAAIPTNWILDSSYQRVVSTVDPRLNWFRRCRRCLSCNYEFITAEIAEDFVDELLRLRSALKDIKENAELYSSDAKKAAETLEKLSSSLLALKALK
jgi:hypothetical protein